MSVLFLATTLCLIAGGLAIIYVLILIAAILRTKYLKDRAAEIHGFIREAALTYIKRQYTVIMTIVIAIATAILVAGISQRSTVLTYTGIAYFLGALSSATVGITGMYIAVLSNVRVLNVLANKGLNKALRVAFRGGAVTGFLVGGLGLLGIALLLIAFGGLGENYVDAVKALLGYAFGASTVALFARVGGGIYTKAADVGADLVGKVEVGIPEDDPRNPGVVADNVGDNVGDCAGMSADLFESYVESVVAAMAIGMLISPPEYARMLIAYPMIFASAAVITTILVAQFIEFSPLKEPSKTLTATSLLSIVTVAIITFIVTRLIAGEYNIALLWTAATAGLLAGGVVGFTSDYFTSGSYRPVKTVASSSRAGPALTILSGLSMGFYSTVAPIIAIAIAAFVAYTLGAHTVTMNPLIGGVYAVALSGVGMLAVASIVVAADAYGPIVDNTAGLAEQAGYPKSIRDEADKLDAAGNTMKSISKGYAIGSAALTALALLFTYATLLKSYVESVAPGIDFRIETLFTLTRADVLAGIIIGAAIPALFTAIVVQAVTAAAFKMVEEIRRQFREKPGILEWKEKPDYSRCVDIVTRYALKRLAPPGILALIAPILIGIFLGPTALGGALMSSIMVGLLLGLFQGNVGNTWDNAKKFIESGHFGGKGSDAHKAAVIGDTVGDPLKDAAG
ncbi:MAG: sodium-translocating pyrophosphatase, partial [Thermoprotei archaeon]